MWLSDGAKVAVDGNSFVTRATCRFVTMSNCLDSGRLVCDAVYVLYHLVIMFNGYRRFGEKCCFHLQGCHV